MVWSVGEGYSKESRRRKSPMAGRLCPPPIENGLRSPSEGSGFITRACSAWRQNKPGLSLFHLADSSMGEGSPESCFSAGGST